MAVGVIDLAEAIDIEAENGEGALLPHRLFPNFVDMLVEGGSVKQSGQGIVLGEVLNLSLALALLGNVLMRSDPAAIFHRLVRHADSAAIHQFENPSGELAVLHRIPQM